MNILHRKTIKKSVPYLLIILMALAILSSMLKQRLFVNGIDTFFHMSVTYDTYQQLKNFNFSYFLSAFGFNHSLRIVNALYGPLGGYLSGFILLITGSWFRWEATTFFLTLFFSGISMYQLSRYWKVNKLISTLISYLYMFSFPIMSMMLFNFQYDGLGAAFVPWVLCLGSRILQHDQITTWKPVLLLVWLAELHILTLLLALTFLVPCCLVSWISSHRKPLIQQILKICLWTIILTANVWGGIIEVLGSNEHHFIPTYSYKNMFQNPWSCVRLDRSLPFHQNLKLLGFSTTVLLIIIVIFYLINRHHLSFNLNFIMIFAGIGYLWLSSRYFPWGILQKYFPILDTNLQFPKRFLPISLSAIYLILGIILSKIKRRKVYLLTIIILCCFIGHSWQNTRCEDHYLERISASRKFYTGPLFKQLTKLSWLVKPRGSTIQNKLHNSHPSSYLKIVSKASPDYLPSSHNIRTDAQYHQIGGYVHYSNQIVKNRIKPRYAIHNHMAIMRFRTHQKKAILPVVKYAHTIVRFNGRLLKHPSRSVIGALIVHPRKGNNTLQIHYQPSIWYQILIIISLILWLIFLALIVSHFLIKSGHLQLFRQTIIKIQQHLI